MSFDNNPYSPTTTQYDPSVELDAGGMLADRSTRLIAAFIDGLIMLVVMLPVTLVLGSLLGVFNGESLIRTLIYTVISGVVGFAAFIVIQGRGLNATGQTIGKKLMNIRIVTDAGTKPEFMDLLIKRYGVMWIIGIIPYVGGLVSLVNVLLIFRENRKCLHDDIAGTKVIKV